MIEVPDLRGEVYDDLLAGVSASEDPEYTILLSQRAFSTTVEEGKVISQDPAPGESMMRGGSIVVVVSQGAPTRELPPVQGLSLAEAAERVTNEGFVPVTERTYSVEIPKGKVVGYKNHEVGEQLAYGSEVTLLISEGDGTSSE